MLKYHREINDLFWHPSSLIKSSLVTLSMFLYHNRRIAMMVQKKKTLRLVRMFRLVSYHHAKDFVDLLHFTHLTISDINSNNIHKINSTLLLHLMSRISQSKTQTNILFALKQEIWLLCARHVIFVKENNI